MAAEKKSLHDAIADAGVAARKSLARSKLKAENKVATDVD